MTNLKSRLQRIEGKQPAAGWEPVSQIIRVIVGTDRKPMMQADGTHCEIMREVNESLHWGNRASQN